ncbi:hypothetical protein ACEQ8H_009003, partial [Pleosporales sp. CAS-2024a]
CPVKRIPTTPEQWWQMEEQHTVEQLVLRGTKARNDHPRRTSPVHAFFNEDGCDGKHTKCVFCSTRVSRAVKTMTTHLTAKCVKAPPTCRELLNLPEIGCAHEVWGFLTISTRQGFNAPRENESCCRWCRNVVTHERSYDLAIKHLNECPSFRDFIRQKSELPGWVLPRCDSSAQSSLEMTASQRAIRHFMHHYA